MFKAFKSLGYETYWFHDNDYPKDFNWDNCVFWTEGFADKNIPLKKSSIYYVMYCPSPKKYLEAEVKRYIDVRTAVKNHADHIHNYSLDKDKTLKIGNGCYFEPKTSNKVHIKNNYVEYDIDDFDKLYLSWATNLLPEEFNLDDIYKPRENRIYFCGTISNDGLFENMSAWSPFIHECIKNNIEFIYNDAWKNPLPNELVKELTQRSILGIDLRGPQHVKTGVINCRVFKNISYGHLGLTNSLEIHKEMEGYCLYDEDPANLFHKGLSEIKNFDFIRDSMIYVKNNHTYINRIKAFLSIL